MNRVRIDDRFDGRFVRSRFFDNPDEVAALQDGQAVCVQRCQKGRVEVLGVNFTFAFVGSDDGNFPFDCVGDNKGAASDIGHRLNHLFDVDVFEQHVETSVFPRLAGGHRPNGARMLLLGLFGGCGAPKERTGQDQDALRPGFD